MLRKFAAVFMVLCMTMGVIVAEAGETRIVADPTAPGGQRPQVLATQNGTPQVNINTPNAGGMSYNRYQQFDVGQNNAILNNSNKNVQTQLGGWVERNPNLAGGGARLIVNEVNSSRPSQLNGFVEVAGQRADVVIANPQGINVDGFGFINANRGTLTTGRPQFDGSGNMTGFRVEDGAINISGRGINDTATYTDIIARTVAVNARVHANNLAVTAGRNVVSPDNTRVTPIDTAETGVSIDVSNLGGMYANSIRLVGTGRGVGVNTIRNAGEIVADVGEVVIDANGMLTSSGVVSGQGGVRVNASGDIVNTGRAQSGGNLIMSGGGAVLNNNGEIVAEGNAAVVAQGGLDNSGYIQSRGSATIAGVAGSFNNSGDILSGGAAEVFAGQNVANTGSIESGANLTVVADAGTIHNKQTGTILSGGAATLAAGENFINAGSVQSEGALTILAENGTFGNSGLLSTGADGALYGKKDMGNTGTGEILAGGDLSVETGKNFINAGGIAAVGDLRLTAAEGIRNSGELLAGNQFIIGETFRNTGLVDGGEIAIKAVDIENLDTGTIFGDHIALEAQNILNGASVDNGHAPITKTQYDPATDTYSYNETGGTHYGDDSLGFDHVAGSQFDPAIEFGDGEEFTEWTPAPGDENSGGDLENEVDLGLNPDVQDIAHGPDAGTGTTTGNSGVIAARNRLDIGFTGQMINREDGLILSGGDAFIGGGLDAFGNAVGAGGRLLNSSATIDVAGNLTGALAELVNYNAHYRTEERLVHSGSYTGYRFTGRNDDTIYIAGIDDIRKGTTKRGAWKITFPYDAEDFFQYDFTRQVYDQFIVESRPGYITTGGNMTITGNVTNNRSIMPAGGKLTVFGDLVNIRAEEASVTRDNGTVRWTNVVSAGPVGNKHKRKYSSPMPYNPAPGYAFSERDVTLFGVPSAAQPGANPTSNILAAVASGSSLSLSGLNGSFYTVNRAPDARYVVETNPRFTDYRTWLSSDFMIGRLSLDPQNMLKRLGDGYYEQRLVREQIVNKTGARFLDGYTGDEEQYAALMLSGVEFAEEFNLEIGVKLSAELMARLTSDIVWLEYVTVDTPDGPVQALAPVVYLAPGREILLASGGGIVSGREVAIAGELKNAGNILGTEKVSLAGNDLRNSGAIAGGLVSLAALRDINNVGGSIVGADGVDLKAGRDINLASSTYQSSTAIGSRTDIAKTGVVAVTGEDGSLKMQAGNDINLKAAVINSAGTAELAAGNDINVGGVSVSYEHETGSKGKNYIHDKTSEDVGSVVYAAGGMKLSAENDVAVTGSQVIADGALSVAAGGDVSVTEGRAESFSETTTYSKSSGLLSSKTEKTHNRDYRNTAIGSELSGNTVEIEAGGGVHVRGSTVAASEGLVVEAGRDITIEGAENHSDSYAYQETKRSGMSASFSGGRAGVSYSSSEKTDTYTSSQNTITSSLVGSETGDVVLYAGKDVNIAGSQVVAGTGDIAISGENVNIVNQYNVYDSWEKHTFKQSGISLSLGLSGAAGKLVEQAFAAASTVERMGEAKTGRAQALYGIAAARQVYDAVQSAPAAMSSVAPGGGGMGGVSVSIGFNSQKNESTSQSHETVAVGSSITSGGDTTIVARGVRDPNGEDGAVLSGTGNLNIIGSTVDAGGWATLAANNDINLLSAEEVSTWQTSNKSSGFGVGVSFNLGSQGYGFALDLSANKGKGSGNGTSVGHAETIIRGREGVEFSSVNDTTLRGAQIIGDTVIGTVGGDLTIISEQDTSNESIRQSSMGGGLSVGFGTFSANFNSQKQKADGSYASVNEQSGIFAGNGGFDISVGGHTGLTGAVISSTAAPEDNLLVTGSISTEDIHNSSNYKAETKGFGGEFTYKKDPDPSDKNANTGSVSPALPMKEQGSGSSDTKSAVSAGTVIVTDDEAQLARTGQTGDEAVADLNRDTDNAHDGPLARNPDLQDILDKQAELADAAAQAGKAVAQTVGDISLTMFSKSGDPKWDEGGIYKIALQGAGAALVAQLGNGQGLDAALGAMANQLASGKIEEFANSLARQLTTDDDAAKLLANLIQSSVANGAGFIVGGATGANAAATMDRWNRAMHAEQAARLRELYGKYQDDPEKIARLLAAAAYLTNAGSDLPLEDRFRADLIYLEGLGAGYTTEINELNGNDNLFGETYLFNGSDSFPYFYLEYPSWAESAASRYNRETSFVVGGGQIVVGGATTGTGLTLIGGGTVASFTGVGTIPGPFVVAGGAVLVYVGKDAYDSGHKKIFDYKSTVGAGIWFGLLNGVAVETEGAKLGTNIAEQALMIGINKVAAKALPAAMASINNLLNKGKITNLPPLTAPSGLSAPSGGGAIKPSASSNTKQGAINNAENASGQLPKITDESVTVIGKVKDLQNLPPGQKSLLDRLPDQGSPKMNWQQNSSVLRTEIRLGKPIRDASIDPTTGNLISYPGSFLEAERNLLKSQGWTFHPSTGLWTPPK